PPFLKRGRAPEGAALRDDVEIVGIRDHRLRRFRIDADEPHHALRLAISERLEQDFAGDAEDRGRRADRQGERGDGGEGEAGRTKQRAKRVAELEHLRFPLMAAGRRQTSRRDGGVPNGSAGVFASWPAGVSPARVAAGRHHGSLRSSLGLAAIARRAGRAVAAATVQVTSRATAIQVAASKAWTPKSSEARAYAAGAASTPVRSRRAPDAAMRRASEARVAPWAARIASSRARYVTVAEITPNRPMAARSSVSAASAPAMIEAISESQRSAFTESARRCAAGGMPYAVRTALTSRVAAPRSRVVRISTKTFASDGACSIGRNTYGAGSSAS